MQSFIITVYAAWLLTYCFFITSWVRLTDVRVHSKSPLTFLVTKMQQVIEASCSIQYIIKLLPVHLGARGEKRFVELRFYDLS